MSPPEPSEGRQFPDASRRTYLAQEGTLLAWWWSGMAAAAVAVGVGAVLPRSVTRRGVASWPGGDGVLAPFVIGGALRVRQTQQALDTNTSASVPAWTVTVVAVHLAIVVLLTVAALV